MTKRLGVLTGGGDAPGLNAVIRAVVLTATRFYDWEVMGIQQGFNGLLDDAQLMTLTPQHVQDLLSKGGTILGTTNKGNFHPVAEQSSGALHNAADEAMRRMDELGLDGIIAAGGDGTMTIAHQLVQRGAPIVGVPKTIDNDLNVTDVTFGFDTAIHIATESLERLKTTAESHHRIMVLEVMGRNAGWIALHAGIAGGADAILIPEIPFQMDVICQHLQRKRDDGQKFNLVIVAEGAFPETGTQSFYDESTERLGGVGYIVGEMLAQCLEAEIRVTVLGHIQRGGQPTARDRLLATAFGTQAVHLVKQEKWGYMVALHGTKIIDVPMEQAIQTKQVDVNGLWVQIAHDVGATFGRKRHDLQSNTTP